MRPKDITNERITLPYCIHRQPNGQIVLINRNYMPVGSLSTEWADWDAIPGLDISIEPEDATLISYKGSPDTSRIYLFNDGCPPWGGKRHRQAYFQRLYKLEALAARHGVSLDVVSPADGSYRSLV